MSVILTNIEFLLGIERTRDMKQWVRFYRSLIFSFVEISSPQVIYISFFAVKMPAVVFFDQTVGSRWLKTTKIKVKSVRYWNYFIKCGRFRAEKAAVETVNQILTERKVCAIVFRLLQNPKEFFECVCHTDQY